MDTVIKNTTKKVLIAFLHGEKVERERKRKIIKKKKKNIIFFFFFFFIYLFLISTILSPSLPHFIPKSK
jgi:hypothetical protein